MSFEYMLPAKWVLNEKMPKQEGTHIEYKEALKLKGAMLTSLHKYRETLIGLLNVGGGYLILGVTNNGIIRGITETDEETLDKFRVWTDIQYGSFLYRDGSRLDPQKTYLKLHVFLVEGTDRKIIAIEAYNTVDALQIQTGGGDIIYRLNASNYKLSTEPIYRHRDVQGLVRTVQEQLQKIIKDQHKTIQDLNDKHRADLEQERDKNEKAIKIMIRNVSDSLYKMYNKDEYAEKQSLCKYISSMFWI